MVVVQYRRLRYVSWTRRRTAGGSRDRSALSTRSAPASPSSPRQGCSTRARPRKHRRRSATTSARRGRSARGRRSAPRYISRKVRRVFRPGRRAPETMTEKRFAFVLAVVIMSLASVQAQRMSRAPSRADGLLVGRVVDTAGRPVGGAVVALSRRAAVERFSSAVRMPGPPQQDRVLTRADGFFVFRDLPLSTFSLTAAKPGYSEGAFGRRRPGGPAQELPVDRGGTAAGDCPAVVEARRHHRRRDRRSRRAADWHRHSVLQANGGQRRAAVRGRCARLDRRSRRSIDCRACRPATTWSPPRAGRSRFRCPLPTSPATAGS